MEGKKFLENVAKNTNIGFIKVFKKGEAEEAVELSLIGFSASELADFVGRTLIAWFRIGEYWYVVM